MKEDIDCPLTILDAPVFEYFALWTADAHEPAVFTDLEKVSYNTKKIIIADILKAEHSRDAWLQCLAYLTIQGKIEDLDEYLEKARTADVLVPRRHVAQA